MRFIIFLFRITFTLFISMFFVFMMFYFLHPIFYASSVIIPYSIYPFDICIKAPIAWKYIKLAYLISYLYISLILSNSIFCLCFKKKLSNLPLKTKSQKKVPAPNLNLYLGTAPNNLPVYIPESSLYQNILVTGTIGSGKTSSSMYPFTKQLIRYKHNISHEKLGMLILDVKGNFYKQVQEYAKKYNRLDDLKVIELGGKIKYNPLDKPNLTPIVLANRLKTILTLFSPNNSESYWLDKAEAVIAEAIKLCRLYNNNYVTFSELHKLINFPNYFEEKLHDLRRLFQSGNLSHQSVYNLYSAINFFENEFKTLDSRVLSILKSEISRMTNVFMSDYNIVNTFSPHKEEITFHGFHEVIDKGKIVVLNMNISLYKNLSKLIAAYLKLDFQSEVLSRLSSGSPKPCVFISDEFHEYVTSTDSDFFAQSREAKCINFVATQSYTSILNTLKDNYATQVIIQNLINKLWFRTDDIFTIENIQKQIGKEDKVKISKSISENAQETNFSYFANSLKSKNSSLSESISSHINYDFIYDTKFFTQELETFSCLAFLSNGSKILSPQKVNMKPYFKDKKTDVKKSKYKII